LFSFIKGGVPTDISYVRTPRVHQSTATPWPFLSMISGAKYSGVPQNELD
jgi:hypothetical protein